jgi:ATP-binding cassette subfamily F protein 3
MNPLLIFYYFFLGILENGAEDFENGNEIYEAIGEILHEVAANKTEDDIK